MPKPMPAIDRFMTKVEKTDTCWLWLACLNDAGYGRFGRGGRGEGMAQAHRWAYEYFVGPVPDTLVIDHLCRNRRCVNPEHLEPVTRGENVMRGTGLPVDNAAKTHCPAGHAYDKDNTYLAPADGARQCRICRRSHGRLRRR